MNKRDCFFIVLLLIVALHSVSQAGLSDKWNRFREKHIDPVGDTVLGPSQREREIAARKAYERSIAIEKAREDAAKAEAEAQKKAALSRKEAALAEAVAQEAKEKAEKAKEEAAIAQAELEKLKIQLELLKQQKQTLKDNK